MATIERGPLITRIWARDPAQAIYSQTNVKSLPLTLLGQDKIFGAPGQTQTYDYPNPRGYIPAIDLRTWAWSVPTSYLPETMLLFAGLPQYDWPVPKGYIFPSDLRTYTQAFNFKLFGVILPGNPNYDWPNPRGYQFPIDLRTWIQTGQPILGRVEPIPTLAFSTDQAIYKATANDSPSGQTWSGAGFMAKYELQTSIRLQGIFMNSLNGQYLDPTIVQLFVLDPAGNEVDYTLQNSVIRDSLGHFHVDIVANRSGVWTYKWQGSGNATATSPDTTFTVNSSQLIGG